MCMYVCMHIYMFIRVYTYTYTYTYTCTYTYTYTYIYIYICRHVYIYIIKMPIWVFCFMPCRRGGSMAPAAAGPPRIEIEIELDRSIDR